MTDPPNKRERTYKSESTSIKQAPAKMNNDNKIKNNNYNKLNKDKNDNNDGDDDDDDIFYLNEFDINSNENVLKPKLNQNYNISNINKQMNKKVENENKRDKDKNEDEDEDEDALLIGIDLENAIPSKIHSSSSSYLSTNKDSIKQQTIDQQKFNEPKFSNQLKRPPSSDVIKLLINGTTNKNESHFINHQNTTTNNNLNKINNNNLIINSKKIKYENENENNDKDNNDDEDIKCFLNTNKQSPLLNTISNNEKTKPKLDKNDILTVEQLSKPDFVHNCCSNNIEKDLNENLNLSSCVHKVKAVCKTLTKPLTQENLKWIQECKISDYNSNKELNSILDVYIGDDAMNNLLGLTCIQAKQMHKKSREIAPDRDTKMKEWEKKFANHKSSCEEKLKTQMFLMFLKYDLKREKFCIIKMINFGLRNDK